MGKNRRSNLRRKIKRFFKARPFLCKSEAPVISLSTDRKLVKNKWLDKKAVESEIRRDIDNLRNQLLNVKKSREK